MIQAQGLHEGRAVEHGFLLAFHLLCHEPHQGLGVKVEKLLDYLMERGTSDVAASFAVAGCRVDVEMQVTAGDEVEALGKATGLLAGAVRAAGGMPMFGHAGESLTAEGAAGKKHWSNRWVLITVPAEVPELPTLLHFLPPQPVHRQGDRPGAAASETGTAVRGTAAAGD